VRPAAAVAYAPGGVVVGGAVLMMPRMTPPERPSLRRDEQLITALVPARLAGGRPPTTTPLPLLPVPGLPVGTAPGDLLVETARLDASGRLTARALVRALGWAPG
jgi:hypothetical protein